jgi:hypothetical protein
MMKAKNLRFRMIVLFLLRGRRSSGRFPSILGREARPSTNRQLQETARPIIADLISEPNVEDINNLNAPDEFFMPKTPIARCCGVQQI